MARKTKAEAQETREKILEAAAQVFSEKGVTSASMEQIAKAAGVTRGAIYWHFENKTAVFIALFQRFHAPFAEMVITDLERDNPDPLGQLEELCVRVLREFDGNPDMRRFVTILLLKCEYAGEMEHVLTWQREMKAGQVALYMQYFERAKKLRQLPDSAAPSVLTMALFCYLSGILLEAVRYPEQVDLGKNAALLIRQFFGGIKPS